jgi:hypothetical protein
MSQDGSDKRQMPTEEALAQPEQRVILRRYLRSQLTLCDDWATICKTNKGFKMSQSKLANQLNITLSVVVDRIR